MKKKLSLLFLGLFLCLNLVSAQNRETRNVGTFTKIAFKVPGKLYLKQGSTQKVEIEATKEVLSKIETSVDGSRLVIRTPDNWNWNWKNDEKINIYITINSFEGLSVAGSGQAIGEGKFNTGDLNLDVSGSGSLDLDVASSGELKTNVSGSGQMNVKGSAKELSSQVSGSGRVSLHVDVSGDSDFSISGSGKIEASGKADELKTSISGSGKVFASDLEVNKADIHISGSGNAEVNVKDELETRISGSGNVRYKGNPNKVNANSSGSGSVSKF
jgi:hypothetical protein